MADLVASSSDRREKLLRLARRSRLKWILDAREQYQRGGGAASSSSTSFPKIPAADSIQEVLRLLGELAADDEMVDLDSLISSIPDGMGELLLDEESTGENCAVAMDISAYNHDLSTGDRSPYGVFLEKLCHYEATDILKTMQQFVAKFDIYVTTTAYGGNPNSGEEPYASIFFIGERGSNRYIEMSNNKAGAIWAFLDFITSEMRANVLWSPTHESADEFEMTKMACERFIFIKLHKNLFGSEVEDIVHNKKMAERLQSLAFLSAEHLDIQALAGRDDSVLYESIAVLSELNSVCSPAEKIDVIKRCSVCIAAALSSLKSSGSQPGADEYLPLLILVIAKANPRDLYSNVAYLQRYVHPSKYVSEAGYLLTNFVSAVHFLENVDANALTITPDEFDSALQRCKVELDVVKISMSKTSSTGGGNFSFNRRENKYSNADDVIVVDDAETVERDLLHSSPHLRQLDIREVSLKRQGKILL